MKMMRRTELRLIAGAALTVPLGGCVTVKTPEKPIEINDDACDALRYAVLALDPNVGAWGSGGAWGVAA